MNAKQDGDTRRHRALRATIGAAILFGLLAGLAAIGAQAPESGVAAPHRVPDAQDGNYPAGDPESQPPTF